jgi:LAO/AO transport system kinase
VSAAELARHVLAGDRRSIARAITLMESTRPGDSALAEELLSLLYPSTGRALRLGIAGLPGAGKSTLVDALGRRAIEAGRAVGVLAIDPSSAKSGGSVLGDRTRMVELGRSARAFVRPSPSSGAGGGIAPRAREALIVLEAGGNDLVIVETVGTGQSELGVLELVDISVLVLISGGGDDVQGIKRGILEHADVVVFNKADGSGLGPATAARDQLSALFSWMRSDEPLVASLSAREGTGVAELWTHVEQRFSALMAAGVIARRRAAQRRAWLTSALETALRARLSASAASAARLAEALGAVERGELLPPIAARRLVDLDSSTSTAKS